MMEKTKKRTSVSAKTHSLFSQKTVGEDGAVLIEYVVLLLVFASLMMAWSAMIYTTQGGFGIFGTEIIQAYQRLMAGISLPVP